MMYLCCEKHLLEFSQLHMHEISGFGHLLSFADVHTEQGAQQTC